LSGRVVLVTALVAADVARHLRHVVRAVASFADETTLLAPRALLDSLDAPAGVTTVELTVGERPGRQDPEAVARLREALRGADVVHAHGARAGAMSVLASRGLGRVRPRVVVTLHDARTGGVGTQAVGLVLDTVVANGADVVLTTSEELLERERRLGTVRRGLSRVVGHRVAVERAVLPVDRPTTGAAAGDGAPPVTSAVVHRRTQAVARFLLHVPLAAPLVVTVTDLTAQARPDDLLDAAAALTVPGARWLVVGDGPLRAELEARIAVRGLGDRVTLLGRRADVDQLLRAADVVASAPLDVVRADLMTAALQAGAAIVTHVDDGGRAASEVLDASARFVPAGDSALLARAVDRLLADPLDRSELQRLARRRARSLPGDRDLRDQLRAVYARPRAGDTPSLTEPDS